MFKVEYWVAKRIDDSECYSVRARTRREVLAELNDIGAVKRHLDGKARYATSWGASYEPPKKVIAEAADKFELIFDLLSEQGSAHEYEDSDDGTAVYVN